MTLPGKGAGGVAGGTGAGAFVAGPALVTFPIRSPASFSAAEAFASVCPTKLGITKACAGGASADSKLIFGAAILEALGDGLCATT